VFLCGEKSV